MVKDAIGSKWQLGTIQVDYNLPERFDLTYIGEDNQKHRPVMIHRAPFGSLERFIALLTEHCAGKERRRKKKGERKISSLVSTCTS